MEKEPLAILKDIAKQFGRSVSSANSFDANVCTSPPNPDCPWDVLALPGDIFRRRLNITIGGRKIKLEANSDFIVMCVYGDFDVDVCSINRRDKMFQLKRNYLFVPDFPSLPVYSREPDTDLRPLLDSASLHRALKCIQLNDRESIHLYRNGIVTYLQRDSKDDVMSAVGCACELAEQLPTVKDGLSLDQLPSKFSKLLDLIPKWAVSDDEQRNEMLEEMSSETLQSFVAKVSPFIPAIDEYLDSFVQEPPTEAVVALGVLAECCLEAQIRLRDAQKK
jgi:hypothetical protein